MNARKRCSGSLAAAREIFAAERSLGSVTTIGPASASAVAILDLPPESADVEEQDRDDEQEQEHGDRGAEAEVVDAAEALAPHLHGNHGGVGLRRAGSDRDHDVEDLEDVDEHRDEHDRQHGGEQRTGAAAERLTLGGAVGARRLERLS